METDPNRRRVKLDIRLDPDMARWVAGRAGAQSISRSAVIRQVLRAAMNADAEARHDGVGTQEN